MKKFFYIAVASLLALSSASAATANKSKASSSAAKKPTAAKTVKVDRVVIEDRKLTASELEAVNLYMKAYDNYNAKQYTKAQNEIALAVSKLGSTNARLSHLDALAAYALGDYKSALASCNAYFASLPKNDAGYAEMQALQDQLNAYFNAKQDAEQAAAQEKAISFQQAKLQKENADKMEQANIAAARENRKARLAANREKRMAEVETALATARATNTRAAYQNFLDEYPYGKNHQIALEEMNKKWPYPTRQLNKKNKYGYVDKSGSYVIKAKYDNAIEFQDERARVGLNGLYGYVDEKGNEVIPLSFKSAGSFNYGYAAVKDAKGNAYFVDKSGKKLANKNFTEAKGFSESLAAVADDSYKFGFINTSGELVISNDYDVVSSFCNGVASVGKKVNGKYKYAYIDVDGDLVTEFVYDEAKDFQRGLGRVKRDGKYGLVETSGNPITTCSYDYITDYRNDGYARAKREGIEVLLDRNGLPWANVNGNMIQVNFK